MSGPEDVLGRCIICTENITVADYRDGENEKILLTHHGLVCEHCSHAVNSVLAFDDYEDFKERDWGLNDG